VWADRDLGAILTEMGLVPGAVVTPGILPFALRASEAVQNCS